MRAGIRPTGSDVHVFLRKRGKRGVALHFFRTLQSITKETRADDEEGGFDEWLVLRFVEGGTVSVLAGSDCVWTEPERH